jgi:LPXTG-site transpeptidase (sortase) family protein
VTSRRTFLRTATGVALATLAPQIARAQASETFGPAEWMRIPKIGVDSHITDVGITDGFYDVPWFDIGHHVDSHNPGEFGNSIFNGHVVTINAGDVFRHLDQLVAGDAVYVYTQSYRLDWAVSDTFSVAQDDNSFLEDSSERRVTLYTCTGQFNPLERSYAERLVVTAQLVSLSVRTS